MRGKSLTVLVVSCLLTGCTTATDAIYGAMEGPRQSTVERRYTFASPDPGIALDTSSVTTVSYGLRGMMEGLSDEKRGHLARAVFGVAAYEGCLQYGFYSQAHKDQPTMNQLTFGKTKARTAEECEKTNQDLLDATGYAATSYLKYGRPDSNRLRTSQLTYGGAAVGAAKTSGRSDVDSWERFLLWGGRSLDGMTRTEILEKWKQFGI